MVSECGIRPANQAGAVCWRRRSGMAETRGALRNIALWLSLTALTGMAGTAALADTALPPLSSLPAPTGPVVLTVTGDITVKNQGGTAVLDDALLAQLPQLSFTTTTNWTEGAHEFSGPTLSSVLAALGAGGGVVDAKAANDYAVMFEPDDIGDQAPIIARLIDGKTFPLRDNGPLWIVYPYDSSADYETEKVYSLSIWQLASLNVRKP
jgi:hypothetical protein